MTRLSAILLICTLTALAGEVTGDWYGTLETPGGNLRLALHVKKDGSGSYSATLDSIDQAAMGIPASGVKFADGKKLTVEIAVVQGELEATVNEAGTELSGTWTQGPANLPLKLTREKFVAKVIAIPLNSYERDFALSHLEKSRKEFLESISGLKPGQWNFKPAGGGWSIAECAEHLITTESALFGMISGQFLKIPLKEGPRMGKTDDDAVIATTLDRTKKAKAPEMLVPTGKYPTPEATKVDFQTRRDTTVNWVKSTQEDLRGRRNGTMDVFQFVLMLSSHTLRHTAQINEVEAEPGYPK